MKLKLFTLSVLALTLLGCGGGSSKFESQLVDNESLGKFPSVFRVQSAEKEKNLEAMREEMQSVSNEDQARKVHDKYVALEEEIGKKAQEIAAAELEKLIDKTVPFEILYDHPDFEVCQAMIDAGDTENGNLTILVSVRAKRDLVASMNSKIGYVILDREGQPIFNGSINPFVSNQIITRQTFPHGEKVAAGEACNWQGSWLMFRCGSYDFTNFYKIVFVK